MGASGVTQRLAYTLIPDFSNPACRDIPNPHIFFSDKYADQQAAKWVCGACDVMEECAEWAMRHEYWGVWGGLTDFERKQIRRAEGIEVSR